MDLDDPGLRCAELCTAREEQLHVHAVRDAWNVPCPVSLHSVRDHLLHAHAHAVKPSPLMPVPPACLIDVSWRNKKQTAFKQRCNAHGRSNHATSKTHKRSRFLVPYCTLNPGSYGAVCEFH